MKITTAQLRQIIKEEVEKALNENSEVQSKAEEFKQNPRRWEMALDTVVDMAFGGDGDGSRSYYPGWQDQDFKDLLVAMGEDLGDYGL